MYNSKIMQVIFFNLIFIYFHSFSVTRIYKFWSISPNFKYYIVYDLLIQEVGTTIFNFQKNESCIELC